jgi:peptidoglycan/LPS O-acetylase OafA/YrhL
VKSLFFIPHIRADGKVIPILFLGWTLNYEMFFYFLFGISLIAGKERAPYLTMFCIIAIVSAGKLFDFQSVAARFFSDLILLEFLYGIIAFLIWRHWRDSTKSIPKSLLIFLCVVVYSLLFTIGGSKGIPHRAVYWGVPSLFLFLCFLILEGRTVFPNFAIMIGNASYSLYLFHPYVLHFFDKKLISLKEPSLLTIIVALSCILICFILAHLCFKHFEQPTIRYARNILLIPPFRFRKNARAN